MKKIKISELPICTTLKGLFTIGTDADNKSVKVSLEFVEEAAGNADTATANANKAATAANNAAGTCKTATDAAKAATTAANDATAKANTAAGNADTATANANKQTEATKSAEDTAKAAAAKADTATAAAKAAENSAQQAAQTATDAANASKTAETSRTETFEALTATLQAQRDEINRLLALLSNGQSVTPLASIPVSFYVEESIDAPVGSVINIAPSDFTPSTCNRSVIFKIYSGAGKVDHKGNVALSDEAGDVVLEVIPTLNSSAAKIVTIHVAGLSAIQDLAGEDITDETGEAITAA